VATQLDAAYVAHVTAQLAIYIGPIAQVLVRKAARESRTRAEFVRKCAENLGTQERTRSCTSWDTSNGFSARPAGRMLAWPGATSHRSRTAGDAQAIAVMSRDLDRARAWMGIPRERDRGHDRRPRHCAIVTRDGARVAASRS
jgi:hypothetical protein